VNVAVVGGGPAGALAALHLARDGARVSVFDASHPREKPCGGGLTGKALDLLPAAPAAAPLPARWVDACDFESGEGQEVELRLPRPVAIASRRELDGWLLERAIEGGVRHVPERVVSVTASGAVRTLAGRDESFDLVVGADGAGSLVRRTLLAPTPTARLAMAAGWYTSGNSRMVVRFTPGIAGYMWLFPRRDHVGVGITAPLASVPTRELMGRLESEVARAFPALLDLGGGRYAHTIPSPSTDPRSLLEIGGERWALVGDAAALADPITGEGIYYALRSGILLAETVRTDASARRYPQRVLDELGPDLLKSAALHERFYAPGFTRRMLGMARRSEAIRDVLADLVLGTQGYPGLKRRLVRALPRVALQVAASAVSA
jgi:flavin-dependent dehydrogenase